MTNARRLVVSVLGAVLVAVPLIRSQDVKPSEAKVIVTQPLAILGLGLQDRRILAGWLHAVPVPAPAMGALDLSRYRDFQFGETLPALAKQVGLALSDVKLIHERPAVMQELEWPIWLGTGSAPQTDPVKTILFSFYNGELFRIVVNYDRDETVGGAFDFIVPPMTSDELAHVLACAVDSVLNLRRTQAMAAAA